MGQTDNKNRRGYVVLSFPTEQMAKEWMLWHDGAGEQFYFEHVEIRGDDGVDEFIYSHKTNVIQGIKKGDSHDS